MDRIRLRAAACLTALATVLSFVLLPLPVQADVDDEYLPGEVLVQLKDTADLSGVASTYGLTAQPISQFGRRPIYRMRINGQTDPEAKADQLKSDPRVVLAEPNFIAQTPEGRSEASWAVGGDAGQYRTQWAPAKMRLPEAHAQNARGGGVTVAVLDTGVDRYHPAFSGRLAPGKDLVDMDDDPSEVGAQATSTGFGHGTHVAGLVALAAPEAKIMPVRVLDPDGRGNAWVLAEALRYALDPDGRPETADGAQVINLSISFRRDVELLETLLEEVTCADDDDDQDESLCALTGGRGVVVVAAAGNGGGTIQEYPAAEGGSGLLAVAASTPTDALAGFSTRGPWVHAAAPGEGILSGVPGGRYASWSGTSMAAGLASGQAALVRARFPSLSAVQAVERIITTAAPIAGAVPRRIDASAATAG